MNCHYPCAIGDGWAPVTMGGDFTCSVHRQEQAVRLDSKLSANRYLFDVHSYWFDAELRALAVSRAASARYITGQGESASAGRIRPGNRDKHWHICVKLLTCVPS